MGSHRVGHNWSDLAAAAAMTFCIFILNRIKKHKSFDLFHTVQSWSSRKKKIYLCIFTLFQIITLLETDFWIGSYSHPIFTYEYTIQSMPSPYYTKTGRDTHSLYNILKYAHLSIEVLPNHWDIYAIHSPMRPTERMIVLTLFAYLYIHTSVIKL